MPSRTRLRSLFSSSRGPCSSSQKQDIVRLIEKRKWKQLRQLLHHPSSGTSIPTPALSSFPQDALQQTALHLLCTRNPPLDIVQKFIDAMPHHPFELDVQEQTPLHTAVAFDASLDVIEYLISINPEAASAKDVDGNTPLILACKQSEACLHFLDDEPFDWTEEIVAILVNASPHTVPDEDIAGMSALEYAISNDSSSKTVGILQKACRQEARRKQLYRQRNASWMARRASELQGTEQTSPLTSASTCWIESGSAQPLAFGIPSIIYSIQGNGWAQRISALSY